MTISDGIPGDLLESLPDSPGEICRAAGELGRQGRTDEAIALLEAASERHDHPAIDELLAQLRHATATTDGHLVMEEPSLREQTEVEEQTVVEEEPPTEEIMWEEAGRVAGLIEDTEQPTTLEESSVDFELDLHDVEFVEVEDPDPAPDQEQQALEALTEMAPTAEERRPEELRGESLADEPPTEDEPTAEEHAPTSPDAPDSPTEDDSGAGTPFDADDPTVIELGESDIKSRDQVRRQIRQEAQSRSDEPEQEKEQEQEQEAAENPFAVNEKTELWDEEPAPSPNADAAAASDTGSDSSSDSLPPGARADAFDAEEKTELWEEADAEFEEGELDAEPEPFEGGVPTEISPSPMQKGELPETEEFSRDSAPDSPAPSNQPPAGEFEEEPPTAIYNPDRNEHRHSRGPKGQSGGPARQPQQKQRSRRPQNNQQTSRAPRQSPAQQPNTEEYVRDSGPRPESKSAPRRASAPSNATLRSDSERMDAVQNAAARMDAGHEAGDQQPGSRRGGQAPGHGPAASPADGRERPNTGENALKTFALAQWRRLRSVASPQRLVWVALGLFGLLVLMVAVASMLTLRDSRQLATQLAAVQRLQSSDTYGGYKRTLQRIRAVRDKYPATAWSSAVESLGGLAPGPGPSTYRAALDRELDYVRSYLEYRFETPGARFDAPPSLENPASAPPLRRAAAVWRALARSNHPLALSLVEGLSDAPGSDRLVDARLAALLDAGRHAEVASRVESLRKSDQNPSVRRLYLLARADRHRDPQSARELLGKIVEGLSPNHMAAALERSELWLDRGAFARAEAEADRLTDDIRDNGGPRQKARHHILLGRAFQGRGRLPRAEDYFRRAIKAAETRLEVHYPLIDLYLQQGRAEEARKRLDALPDTASRADGTDATGVALRRAEYALLLGRYDRAVSALAEIDRPTPRMRFRHGQALVLSSRAERALEILPVDAAEQRDSESLEVDSGQTGRWTAAAKAWALLAKAELDTSSGDDLLVDLGRVLGDHRDSPIVLHAAGRLHLHLAAEAEVGSERHRTHLKKARRHLERRMETRSDGPTHDATARFLLCRVHSELDAPARARSECRKAMRRRPGYLPGVATWAEVQLAQGDAKGALDTLKQAEEASEAPESWQLARVRIEALIALRRLERARDRLDTWIGEGVGDTPYVQWLEGRLAYAAGDYEAAVGYLKRAADKLAGKRPSADLARARSLARLGDEERGVRVARRYLDHPDHGGTAWLVFAEARRRQHRYYDARENLSAARLRLDNPVPEVRADLDIEEALTWVGQRGWDYYRIDNMLADAREHAPDAPRVDYAWGQYYLYGRSRAPQKAAEHLERALEKQPKHCGTLRALYEAYDRLGDTGGLTRVNTKLRNYCGG